MTLRWYCFGGFRVEDDGHELDLAAVRPRSRALLRYLAAAGDRSVHREQIIDTLWPDLAESTAVNSLHVAVSTLRTFLEPGVARGASRYIVRSGESYRLAVGSPDQSDVTAFTENYRAGKRAAADGRTATATGLLRTALQHYDGDLLPEDGPATWVVAERDRYRAQATTAAGLLAGLELDRGRPAAAATAARRALELDGHDDAGWRLLIAAQQRAGDHAAAAHSRLRYDRVLRDLDVAAARAALTSRAA
ncbi:AfsR/SARP family transcriptional regulator [Symbioplanes lichenis]|uniref:AfsR/SARP family transcriptional regulator n=1 Tax=Symbioplanes lichenis TaxID=1629072 RepID=UPI002739CF75|nr:BTAD domain-containing putative transcriptional regulator [Actinoplanes lichenis]